MITACPGCGLRLPASDGPTHAYMTASPACWATFGRVLAREYADPALLVTHRLGVDAYAVQHPGGTDRQSVQSVGLHLVRLHLSLGRDLAPDAVNRIAIRIARHKHVFTWLEPPRDRGAITVGDVDGAERPAEHGACVRRWAQSAFRAWSPHHAQVAAWAGRMAAG